jgi:thiol-disulfide isomerase/thioredoxin
MPVCLAKGKIMRIALRIAVFALIGLNVFSSVMAAGIEGRPAPVLALADADGVTKPLLERTGGKPAIVLFWASWCPYCEALMPPLAQLQKDYGDRIAVIAVNVWDEADVDPVALIKARGYSFTVLRRGDKATERWRVKGTPGLFVLNGEGLVVFDRNARPFAQANVPQSSSGDRRSSTERSAALWAASVRAELEKLLPR